MNSQQVVETFLEFFRERGHHPIPGCSLVPRPGDPVLFTTSGMHPLTPFLEGQPHPHGGRLTLETSNLLRDDPGVGFFRGGDIGAGAAKFGFRITDALGKCLQFRAQDSNLVVNPLQLDKVRNRRVHEQTILAHGRGRLCGNRGGG